jgi:pimeloyl-ACP methyl ester carboxylesterase
MSKPKNNKHKNKDEVEKGFYEDGLPYVRIGNKPNIIVSIEALSFKHEPASGFMLKQFLKEAKIFTEKYTVYLVGRKQNIPGDYSFDDMATDYGNMIRREFSKPVDIIGVSTGGQIAQYLAANHPDTVRKLVIISAAYRLSEKGIEIERKAAEYFQKGKYGRSLAVIMNMALSPGIKRSIIKFFIRLMGKRMVGKIKYPNDFLAEVKGDREMNFKDRLHEIEASTLIISGEDDIAYTLDDVQITSEGIPNNKLILYPGYGHNLMINKWKHVMKDALEFLNS